MTELLFYFLGAIAIAEMHKYREQAIIRHANKLVEERNMLRAQLVAYSEPPRFMDPDRGQA